MKTFTCSCGQHLFFENSNCVNCKKETAFLPDLMVVSDIVGDAKGAFVAGAPEATTRTYKKCQNYSATNVCNWVIPIENKSDNFCISCRLNDIIPDLSLPQNVEYWALVESAKRRLIYSALRLHLPLKNRIDDPANGLGFRFLADTVNTDGSVSHVITEHDHGLITLNIAEADDSYREKTRLGMKEPYRTLLGHFRHESGHYYWDRLVLDTKFLEPCRKIFGDERLSYEEAQKNYYSQGAPINWQDRYISAYATMHPWEDWAETWAHYLHIQDTLETAADFGLVGRATKIDPVSQISDKKSHLRAKPFNEAIKAWSELSVGINSINRSMGLRDIYPFILAQPVIDKLFFISEVIGGNH